ncbi:hypothetical protein BAUCODRAFT_335300 [Baudoinia panamericana UAMH 10762]|uniref:Uncharacterized protein n=1 Tax=Baudoinia panamericana (strain UAMH 10762) TaxID=717646 RepID=M2M2U6_BAUPA|nr:uncharacterized protein BAUCODRAFT_335300 [Baudoinia panamericana UAMH 10762]EMC90851.1 hypothetical protein BAUCODRAFT_335300 [Baudoinia panamericana UAMH 10762]
MCTMSLAKVTRLRENINVKFKSYLTPFFVCFEYIVEEAIVVRPYYFRGAMSVSFLLFFREQRNLGCERRSTFRQLHLCYGRKQPILCHAPLVAMDPQSFTHSRMPSRVVQP